MSKILSNPRPIRPDDLIALNDEIAALSNAGVPLEKGLLHLGKDLPGRMGNAVTKLAGRLERGESLVDAIGSIPSLPAAYSAIIVAGARSGQLGVALQDMASLMRRNADMHRLVYASLIYPVFVLFVAVGLFNFTLSKCFPVVNRMFQEVAPDSIVLMWGQWLSENRPWIVTVIPLTVVVALVAWWWRSRYRWMRWTKSRRSAGSGRRTSVHNMIRAGRMATLTETLAMLLQHRVPLPEAIRLASDACGDVGISESGTKLADRLSRGEIVNGREALPGGPPLLGCILTSGRSTEELVSTLRRMAEAYRQTALWMVRWLSISVPFWLTVSIGGLATLVYGLTVFWPFSQLLLELSSPNVPS